ncbi:MAG: hypothetical protein ABSH33_18720, partial [Steroidobacteraceae bacterium]
MSTSFAIALLAAAAHTATAAATATAGAADPGRPGYTGSADFVQHLGQSVPADLPFRDERGNAVRLGSYLGSAPIGLIFSYYR